jgi:hypothetical protein
MLTWVHSLNARLSFLKKKIVHHKFPISKKISKNEKFAKKKKSQLPTT